MRRKGRIALGLVVAAAILGVSFVALYPADRLRPELEARLSAAAGVPVRLGRLSISVLGGIGVRADGLQIGPRSGRAGGQRTTLSAASARIRFSIGGLLRGRAAIRGVDLGQAELRDSRGILVTDGSARTEFSQAGDGSIRLSGSFEGRPAKFPAGEKITGRFRAEFVEDRIELPQLEWELAGGSFRGTGTVDGVRAGAPRIRVAGEGTAGQTRGTGSASAVLAAGGADIRLDVTFSNFVDRDLIPVLALVANAKSSSAGEGGAGSRPASNSVRIAGEFRADRARIASVDVRNFRSDLTFDDGRLSLAEADFELCGGTESGRLSLDLSDPKLPFRVESHAAGIDVKSLQEALGHGSSAVLEGTAQFDLQFAGNAPAARIDRSSVIGTLRLEVRDGRIANLGILAQVSALAAHLEQRDGSEDTPFQALTADFRLEGGDARAQSLTVRSEEVNLDGQGRIGLDGAIDLDLTASLAPAVTASLQERVPSLRHWIGADRRLSVPLRLAGTVRDPRVSMDIDRAASEALAKFLEEKGRRGALRRLLGGR